VRVKLHTNSSERKFFLLYSFLGIHADETRHMDNYFSSCSFLCSALTLVLCFRLCSCFGSVFPSFSFVRDGCECVGNSNAFYILLCACECILFLTITLTGFLSLFSFPYLPLCDRCVGMD